MSGLRLHTHLYHLATAVVFTVLIGNYSVERAVAFQGIIEPCSISGHVANDVRPALSALVLHSVRAEEMEEMIVPSAFERAAVQIAQAPKGRFQNAEGSTVECGLHNLFLQFGFTFMLLSEMDEDWEPEFAPVFNPEMVPLLTALPQYLVAISEVEISPIAPPPDFSLPQVYSLV